MINAATDPHILLTLFIALLTIVSYALRRATNQLILKQQHIDLSMREYFQKSRVAVLVFPAVIIACAVGIAWHKGGPYFDFIAGGTLLTLLVGTVQTLQMYFYYRGILAADAVQGNIKFSAKFSVGNMASRLLSGALLMAALYGLFGELAYLGASCFLLAGYLRYQWYLALGYF